MRHASRAVRSFAAGTLAATFVVAFAGCTYAVKTPTGVVRFVSEQDALRILPLVSIEAIPTKSDSLLRIHLKKKVYGPIYEAELNEEASTEVSYSPMKQLSYVLATGLTAGLILLMEPAKTLKGLGGINTKELGTRQVQGKPRKTGEMGETEGPWPGGSVSIDINGLASRDLVTDAQGNVELNLAEGIGMLGEPPRMPVTVRVGAVHQDEKDERVFRLDRETSRHLYLQSVDMSSETPGAIPDLLLRCYLDEGGMVAKTGGHVTLVVEAFNRGGGPTSQLRGVISSPNSLFDGKEVVLGKILPGMRRTWFEEISIPRSVRPEEIPIRIRFSERNGFAPDDIVTRIMIRSQ